MKVLKHVEGVLGVDLFIGDGQSVREKLMLKGLAVLSTKQAAVALPIHSPVVLARGDQMLVFLSMAQTPWDFYVHDVSFFSPFPPSFTLFAAPRAYTTACLGRQNNVRYLCPCRLLELPNRSCKSLRRTWRKLLLVINSMSWVCLWRACWLVHGFQMMANSIVQRLQVSYVVCYVSHMTVT